jgi:HK97 gp10 family phage protein
VADTQTLHGLDDVLRKLQSLPPEIVSKRGGPVKSALRKGGKVIQQAAAQNIEAQANTVDGYENTHLLSKSVGLTRDPNPAREGANERYFISVRRRRYQRGQTTGQVARWLESGRENQPPKPWLRPAFVQNAQKALDTVVTELNKGIDRIIKKLSI